MLDIAALDALDLRVIVDNETDGLSSVDEGHLALVPIVDMSWKSTRAIGEFRGHHT